MKVVSNSDEELVFDNGLKVVSHHSQDCCEHNYLDFEQLPVGTELPDYTAAQFIDSLTIKDDGFIVKDSAGIPKWVQARSSQNGYYSRGVSMHVSDGKVTLDPKKPGQSDYGDLFEAGEDDIY